MPFLRRSDLRGLTLLVIALALTVAGTWWWVSRSDPPVTEALSPSDLEKVEILRQRTRKLSRQRTLHTQGLRRERLFPFDPNHADSLTLSRLGLPPWQVHNLLKYRRKGGTWRHPDDLSRLYGLSAEDFALLRPYIRISAADRRRPAIHFERYHPGTPKGERPEYERIEKLAEGSLVELNSCDTTLLKQIPGIGSYYARKIIAYRERLGGFSDLSQINEVAGLPPGISRWFTLTSHPDLRRIRINHATFKELVRHPYLSYEQTKTVVNHIRQYGPLHGWRDLRLYKEFTDADFRRLSPYFSFE